MHALKNCMEWWEILQIFKVLCYDEMFGNITEQNNLFPKNCNMQIIGIVSSCFLWLFLVIRVTFTAVAQFYPIPFPSPLERFIWMALNKPPWTLNGPFWSHIPNTSTMITSRRLQLYMFGGAQHLHTVCFIDVDNLNLLIISLLAKSVKQTVCLKIRKM